MNINCWSEILVHFMYHHLLKNVFKIRDDLFRHFRKSQVLYRMLNSLIKFVLFIIYFTNHLSIFTHLYLVKGSSAQNT